MYSEETANESLTSTEMMSPSLQIQQEKNKNQSAFSLTSQKLSVFFRSFIQVVILLLVNSLLNIAILIKS